NRALLGKYPPGSTFKVVTASALVADGAKPDAPRDPPRPVPATLHGYQSYPMDVGCRAITVHRWVFRRYRHLLPNIAHGPDRNRVRLGRSAQSAPSGPVMGENEV
ncbi:hypothetical protein, partial [Nonomuraea sp. NPDC050691]|uniref:hypothetical protein n=1 Tax=Nonomuraea sp. NPDC050691 TaxID=3155661 RepID=UPI00340A1765